MGLLPVRHTLLLAEEVKSLYCVYMQATEPNRCVNGIYGIPPRLVDIKIV